MRKNGILGKIQGIERGFKAFQRASVAFLGILVLVYFECFQKSEGHLKGIIGHFTRGFNGP